MRTRDRRNRGFTLIELLTVIVVIGILTVIAMPRFLRPGDDARRETMYHDIKTYITAVQTYRWRVQSSARTR